MKIRVLGAGAGGGYPQWNCNHPNSRRARSGDPAASPRTQSSIALSADGLDWVICNASPDLRQQIGDNAILHPRDGLRHSPIQAVVLTNADVDHIAGLLNLRESQPLQVVLGEAAAPETDRPEPKARPDDRAKSTGVADPDGDPEA